MASTLSQNQFYNDQFAFLSLRDNVIMMYSFKLEVCKLFQEENREDWQLSTSDCLQKVDILVTSFKMFPLDQWQ